jgi:cell surface protein SprA
MDPKTYQNDVYKEFLSNRKVIANRLAEERRGYFGYDPETPGINGFPDGYPSFSQEVVIPAFIAAYVDGPKANNVALEAARPIMSLFRPDWRVDYDGFMQISWFKRKFRNFKLQHSYKGVFTMGGYINNPEFFEDPSTEENPLDVLRNVDSTMFRARYNINQITVSEDFMPLFEINMTWKSNITTRFAFNKSRTVS